MLVLSCHLNGLDFIKIGMSADTPNLFVAADEGHELSAEGEGEQGHVGIFEPGVEMGHRGHEAAHYAAGLAQAGHDDGGDALLLHVDLQTVDQQAIADFIERVALESRLQGGKFFLVL